MAVAGPKATVRIPKVTAGIWNCSGSLALSVWFCHTPSPLRLSAQHTGPGFLLCKFRQPQRRLGQHQSLWMEG